MTPLVFKFLAFFILKKSLHIYIQYVLEQNVEIVVISTIACSPLTCLKVTQKLLFFAISSLHTIYFYQF
jgi:hypothetical protein